MLKNVRILFIFSLIFLVSAPLMAQKTSRKKLEAKRIILKKEINKIKIYLDKTKKKERSLSNQVKDLNQKVQTRQDLINTISDEIASISDEIDKNLKEINLLQDELNALKTEYANLIYKSYKNKSEENRLLFLLSSDSFFQGFQRFQYMKQYTQYRKNQGDSIKDKAMKLRVMNDSLAVKKITKNNLIDEKKYEQGVIVSEKEKQEILVKKYSKKKRKYQAQIRKKQREERKLTQQIENSIRGAIKKSGTKSKTFALTPAAKALAAKFTSNKGKLPWPVEKGLVTVRFGKQSDPMDSSLKIESSGVRIATNEHAKARAVFDGKVMDIHKNPQNGSLAIMIQHGNYITVYANLESTLVSKGDKVKTKQSLGNIHTDRVTGKTILKFQIWKDVQKQNPSNWVYKM
jgi:septal ring factor EnvC (AmiA/AmiB activator)